MSPAFRSIVWPLAVAETIVWAALYYSFAALLPEWERELGWSKTELSGAFTLALVVSAALAPISGRLIDRGHGRAVFVGGTLAGAALLALLSQVTALWQFYCVWLAIGVTLSGILYDTTFAVLTRSMGPEAKRAITLVTLVAGFAGTLSFPSAHALAAALGWRAALLTFAAAVLVVALPLIWHATGKAEAHGTAHAPPHSPSAAQALRILGNPAFWLLGLAFAAIGFDHGMIITHVLPILDDRGVHAEAAVLTASMIGPMQVAGRLAMMAAERHVSGRAIAMGCYVSLAIAAGALRAAAATPGLLVAFIIFQGAGVGVTSIIRPVVTAELLGRRNFGVIAGLLAAVYTGATAAAPTVAALLWLAGGYDLVLAAALAAVVAGLALLLAAWRAATSRPAQE